MPFSENISKYFGTAKESLKKYPDSEQILIPLRWFSPTAESINERGRKIFIGRQQNSTTPGRALGETQAAYYKSRVTTNARRPPARVLERDVNTPKQT